MGPRLQCARRMESEVEMTSIQDMQMNLAGTDKRAWKDSMELREVSLKLEKH